jgi:hypothetical protein
MLLLGSPIQESESQTEVDPVVVGAGLEEERRVASSDQAAGEQEEVVV